MQRNTKQLAPKRNSTKSFSFVLFSSINCWRTYDAYVRQAEASASVALFKQARRYDDYDETVASSCRFSPFLPADRRRRGDVVDSIYQTTAAALSQYA